jgi:hypothetical protein
MTRPEHEPRAACVDYPGVAGWIGTCSRGCCVTGRQRNAAAALAAVRPLIEARDIDDQLQRSDDWWRTHTRTEATS